MPNIINIYQTFPNIENNAFKKKVYDACVLFATEHNNILTSVYKTNRFPDETYNNLEDLSRKTKPDKEKSHPIMKKKSPVKKNADNNDRKEESDNKEIKSENLTPKKTSQKQKSKKNHISFNRNAKSVIDFIINRFLWEVYYIQPDGSEVCPESKPEIEKYILNNINTEFTKEFNISELIINSVKIFKPSKTITESYGLNKEICSKFMENFEDNPLFANVISEYLTDFIKLLMIFFSNRFWLEKSSSVNFYTFQTVLRYIELSIPNECNTLSNGLMDEIVIYDNFANKKRPTKEKPTKEKPTKEKPTKEKPTKEKPTKEKPTKERSTKERPTKERPTKEPKPTKNFSDSESDSGNNSD